ncbi:hypothetical protein ACJX0J_020748, partial [Zea mays]
MSITILALFHNNNNNNNLNNQIIYNNKLGNNQLRDLFRQNHQHDSRENILTNRLYIIKLVIIKNNVIPGWLSHYLHPIGILFLGLVALLLVALLIPCLFGFLHFSIWTQVMHVINILYKMMHNHFYHFSHLLMSLKYTYASIVMIDPF